MKDYESGWSEAIRKWRNRWKGSQKIGECSLLNWISFGLVLGNPLQSEFCESVNQQPSEFPYSMLELQRPWSGLELYTLVSKDLV